MTRADARAEESLNQLLDELAADPAPGFSAGSAAVEPGLVRAVHLVRARDDAPGADPAFVDRLLDEILAGAERRLGAHVRLSPQMTQSPLKQRLERMWSSSRPGGWSRSRWAIAQLATAALLALTLVSSFLAFGPGRHQRPEQAPAHLPAASSPSVGNEAATVVWESRGDPEQPLKNPGHLTLDPAGNLWVSDGLRDQFQILSPDGTFLERWGTPGTRNGEFNLNEGINSYGAVAFDRAGNLYVADAGNYRIQKFAPDRSFILAWGKNGRGNGEFLWPDHLVVDAQGQVYVLDGERDDIQVFDANGTYLRTIGGYGRGDGQFMFDWNSGLTFDDAGNLWVADGSNQRIQEFSPDGTFLRAFGGYGLSQGKFVTPNGVAVDRVGRVFVVDVGKTGTRVQIFSTEGAYLGGWSETGGAVSGLSPSSGLVLDGTGNVYVTDYDNGRIFKLQLLPPFAPNEVKDKPSVATRLPPTTELMWQTTGNPEQPLDHPIALALDAAGRIWATDTFHHQYQILSADGAFLETWGDFGSGPGQFNFQMSVNGIAAGGHTMSAGGIAFAPDGSFYVADSGNHRVQKFGSDRAFLYAWGSEGKGDGQFEWPSDVALDSQGRVYVADNLRSDVQVFTHDGAYLRTIGRFGTGDGQLYLYGGGYVTVAPDDSVWVSDASNERLQKFSAEGDLLATIGRAGAREGQFSWPGQVAIDGAGRLFVADATNRRVQVFAPDGSFLMALGDQGLGLTYGPIGVAPDAAGNVYVADIEEDRVVGFRLVPPFGPASPES